MPARIRWLIYGGLGLAAIASTLFIRTASDFGAFTTLAPRFDGQCAALDGLAGSEDMVFDRERRVVYVSSFDRRADQAGTPTRGAIYAVPFDAPQSLRRIDLTGGAPADFRPHGLDLHIDADGTRRLFVINHRPGGDTLDIFRIAADAVDPTAPRLIPEASLSDPLLRNANDVLALSPVSAYITLDSAYRAGHPGQVWEALAGRRNGAVVHITPDGARRVAEDLAFANGLALNATSDTLYVAETLGRSIALFARDPADDSLRFTQREFIGAGVDNITPDPQTGLLWIAAHPKLLDFVGHAGDAGAPSPSQIIIIEPNAGQGDQVFLSDGVSDGGAVYGSDGLAADISGASVVVADVEARRMLIGSVFEDHILACDLPQVWRHSQAYPASRPIARGQ